MWTQSLIHVWLVYKLLQLIYIKIVYANMHNTSMKTIKVKVMVCFSPLILHTLSLQFSLSKITCIYAFFDSNANCLKIHQLNFKNKSHILTISYYHIFHYVSRQGFSPCLYTKTLMISFFIKIKSYLYQSSHGL